MGAGPGKSVDPGTAWIPPTKTGNVPRAQYPEKSCPKLVDYRNKRIHDKARIISEYMFSIAEPLDQMATDIF